MIDDDILRAQTQASVCIQTITRLQVGGVSLGSPNESLWGRAKDGDRNMEVEDIFLLNLFKLLIS